MPVTALSTTWEPRGWEYEAPISRRKQITATLPLWRGSQAEEPAGLLGDPPYALTPGCLLVEETRGEKSKKKKKWPLSITWAE